MTNSEKPALSLAELRSKAENYCARAERCTSEVRTKLLAWGANEQQLDSLLAQLRADRYLDDLRYASAFVRDKVRYQHWGIQKVRYGLRAKQLPDTIISVALEEIDQQDYAEQFRKALMQKRTATREQQVRFLLSRGFTFDDIRRYSNMDLPL